MDTVQLSEIITEVLRRINISDNDIKQKKKALVIIEDFHNGHPVMEDIRQAAEGYNINLLTVKNTLRTFAPEDFESIYMLEDLPSDCNEWIRQFEKILIPSPSLKIVSKIAHVIFDNKFIEIVFTALREGKQVLIGHVLEDCNVKNLSESLRLEIKRLVSILEGYGIGQMTPQGPQRKCLALPEVRNSGTRNVLSLREVVERVGNGNELSICTDMIITPLAMDYIRDKKISLKRNG